MSEPIAKTRAARVLIVEDNELNQMLFRDLLMIEGADVIQTRDGTQVMGLVRAERPDLILMDIQLPQVSGLDLTAEIRADPALSDIPIIAVTAFAMKGDEDKIRAGGCNDYISKPIAIQDFQALIRKYIH